MPEAAEVELVKRGINSAFAPGFDLFRIDVLDKNIGTDKFKNIDLPAPVLDIVRHGKFIGIVSDRFVIKMHLRLSGRILIGHDPEARALIWFKKGSDRGVLSLSDPRRFATIDLSDRDSFSKNLGIDLLDGNLDLWVPPLKSTRPVKTVMLDQSEIAGIGNYLIDEALWYEKINPTAPFNTISSDQALAIAYRARGVAKEALSFGGVSVRDYVSVLGETGSFQDSLKAYGRAGRPCGRCGRDLEKTKVGGRGTVFCGFCQA